MVPLQDQPLAEALNPVEPFEEALTPAGDESVAETLKPAASVIDPLTRAGDQDPLTPADDHAPPDTPPLPVTTPVPLAKVTAKEEATVVAATPVPATTTEPLSVKVVHDRVGTSKLGIDNEGMGAVVMFIEPGPKPWPDPEAPPEAPPEALPEALPEARPAEAVVSTPLAVTWPSPEAVVFIQMEPPAGPDAMTEPFEPVTVLKVVPEAPVAPEPATTMVPLLDEMPTEAVGPLPEPSPVALKPQPAEAVGPLPEPSPVALKPHPADSEIEVAEELKVKPAPLDHAVPLITTLPFAPQPEENEVEAAVPVAKPVPEAKSLPLPLQLDQLPLLADMVSDEREVIVLVELLLEVVLTAPLQRTVEMPWLSMCSISYIGSSSCRLPQSRVTSSVEFKPYCIAYMNEVAVVASLCMTSKMLVLNE